MKIQTMSIVCGTKACNANCPFCISKMTPSDDILSENINIRNLKIACKLAKVGGATTCLITGKGEPTLYPELITEYIEHVNDTFPLIELQTNGINLSSISTDTIMKWHRYGLTTICLSSVHYDKSMNREIYGKEYPDIKELTKRLHDFGFTVRLSVMLLKGYIDSESEVKNLINYCRDNNIKQLTIRPITAPCGGLKGNEDVFNWIMHHKMAESTWEEIKLHVSLNSHKILELPHGATIYDYNGQNICLSTCVTTNETSDDMRQIIFYPDGTISFDWKYKGSIIL